ncbi:hypothetical protein [Emticicia soli]|uniref:DUF2975 domain-containing protein n=1 Tax=Emticicia soli TaxID=2027878 RepID=A0ABW5JCY1_9BACT
MNPNDALIGYTDLIQRTDTFIRKNAFWILGLGLIAGIGRFIQEGGSGAISSSTQIILDIGVNTARLLTVFIIIGKGSLQNGLSAIAKIFRLTKAKWVSIWDNIKRNFSGNYLALLVNFIIYTLIAVIINIGLFILLDHTAFLEWLKSNQLLSPFASKWPVLLLLKNISIIPFTLVFEVLIVSWIVEKNKMTEQ